MADTLEELMTDEPERPNSDINHWRRIRNALRAELRPKIAVLLAGRCVSCMEPINPLTPRCACIRAELAELRALRESHDALRDCLDIAITHVHMTHAAQLGKFEDCPSINCRNSRAALAKAEALHE